MRRAILPTALALPAAMAHAAPTSAGGPITVTVSGIRSDQGKVQVGICPEATFLNACPWSIAVPAQKGEVTVTLRGIPPGRYAVQAFHDANANGKVDQGIFGIPREGIGFSNDAMAKLVKPKWAAAAFDHGAVAQTLPVTVRYFLG